MSSQAHKELVIMLLGPGSELEFRRSVKKELDESDFGFEVIIMEDIEKENRVENLLDIKFERVIQQYNPVFVAFFIEGAKSMEGVIFEIGCICCKYGCNKIGDRLMLLSNKKYNYEKRTPYIATLFSRARRDEYDEKREYYKASKRIEYFVSGILVSQGGAD